MQVNVLKYDLDVKIDTQKALNRIGIRLSQWSKERIIESTDIFGNPFVPLAPSTIKRKGSSKPLIDTGLLLNSIGYAVSGNTVVVGVLNNIVDYAQVHNRGSRRIPKRQFLPEAVKEVPRDWYDIIKQEVNNAVFNS